MSFESDFRLNFQDKYQELHLKEVVVNKAKRCCTITFLYPSTSKELSEADKKEIILWIKDYVGLDFLDLKVKFKRVFVEEKLILKDIQSFFAERYKLVETYIKEEAFKIEITNIDVIVDITVSKSIEKYFADNKIVSELSNFLKENYLVEFTIKLTVDETFVDDVDIESVVHTTAYKPTQRYSVDVVKEIVGDKFMTSPEFLSNIKEPKKDVVAAGFISKFTRKDYVQKSGQRAGAERVLFSFVLDDEKGKMECVHFCAKRNVQVLESLEDYMFVLVEGDVQKSTYSGKLQLNVKKMALASKEIEIPEEYVAKEDHALSTVKTESLTTLSQGDMFTKEIKYNDKVNGKTCVVFDIETTGLDKSNDQIIEIGAVKLVDGKFKEKFQTFVKPTNPIPMDVTKLTGITDDMVKNAPSPEQVLKDFYEFTRDSAIVGQNVIDFDMMFVKRIGKEYGLTFDNEVYDTYVMARQAHLQVTNFKLGTLVKYFGFTLEGAHRAWNDAYATAQVFLKLCEIK